MSLDLYRYLLHRPFPLSLRDCADGISGGGGFTLVRALKVNEGSVNDISSPSRFGSDAASPFEFEGFTTSELKVWISDSPKSTDAMEMEPRSSGSTRLNEVRSLS